MPTCARDDVTRTMLAVDFASLLIDAGAPLSAGQVRLNAGVVDKSFVIANFCLFAGLESRRVYHQTFVLPNNVQPMPS